jgi:hypothetical protein
VCLCVCACGVWGDGGGASAGTVFLRGLSTHQALTGAASTAPALGTSFISRADIEVLLNVTGDLPLDNGQESSLQRTAMPKCSPVLLWTHNRIECMIVPSRAPKVGGGMRMFDPKPSSPPHLCPLLSSPHPPVLTCSVRVVHVHCVLARRRAGLR